MGALASQITSLMIGYSTVYSDADQRKHQSSASLAFVRGIHRRPVNSPHKWPVNAENFPFDDVIMKSYTGTVHVERKWRVTQDVLDWLLCTGLNRSCIFHCSMIDFQRSDLEATYVSIVTQFVIQSWLPASHEEIYSLYHYQNTLILPHFTRCFCVTVSIRYFNTDYRGLK